MVSAYGTLVSDIINNSLPEGKPLDIKKNPVRSRLCFFVESVGDTAESCEPLCCLFEAMTEGAGEAGNLCCFLEAVSAVDAPCYVATASIGFDPENRSHDELHRTHPDLVLLRRFRDQVLSKSRGGRAFTAFYYRFGRYPARVVRRSALLRVVSRTVVVRPLVAMAKVILRQK